MPSKIVKRKTASYEKKNRIGSVSNGVKNATRRVLDGLVYLSTHYGRFTRDLLGIVLMVVSLLTLMALLGLTGGVLLLNIVAALRTWFGWGAILIDISLGIFGYLILKRKGNFWLQYFWKVVYFELLIFSFLSFLAVLSDYDLAYAKAGEWGGLVGWALAQGTAEAMGKLLSSALWILLLLALTWIGVVILRYRSGVSAGRQSDDDQLQSDTSSPDHLTVKSRYETGKQQSQLPSMLEVVVDKKLDPQKAQSAHSVPVSTPAARSLMNLSREPIKPVHRPAVVTSTPAKHLNRESSLPPLSLLMEDQVVRMDENTINQTAAILEKTLMDFGIPAKVIGFRMGPTVTQFAVEPGYIERPAPDGQITRQKIRVSQISQLSRDLALALSATSIRIEAPVAGKSYVGIEIPNVRTVEVRMKSLLESEKFNKLNSPLALAFGKDVSGQAVVGDLSRMPHLLIAGTTGSGKTVCMTALAACLAMNNSPEDLRLIMIDPKMVELVRFNGLPHMFGKVETELDRILGVLRWVTQEMDRRYIAFSSVGARDLDNYNKRMEKRGEPVLPRIVVFIDELADLMMNAQASTEPLVVRLAQLARATGIHLIVATQRPSASVVTGLIKANFPGRISFSVASHVDSRVILDTGGAESLLGKGDMLFVDPEKATPIRTQGVLVSDEEVERIISHWKNEQRESLNDAPPWENMLFEEQENGGDSLIQQAIEVVKESRQASASLIQRKLHIGYPRAARLIEELEEMHIIGPIRGGGRDREVLIDLDDEDEGGQG